MRLNRPPRRWPVGASRTTSLPGPLLDDVLDHRRRRERVGPTRVECEMADDLAGLLLGQPVIHRPVQMVGDLRDLACRDERADGHETPVARREPRSQPEIAEQHIRRVLDEAGRDLAKLLADTRRPLRLRRLVEEKLRTGSRRKLVGADVAGLEHVLRRGDGIHRVCPAGVERQVRDDFRQFGRLHAVVEREVEIVRKFDHLIARDERGDRDDASVARWQTWSLPEIAEHDILRISFEGGRDGANDFGRGHGFYSFDGLLTVGRAGDDRKRKYGRCEKLHYCCPPTVGGFTISQDATNEAQSTVTALTRNTTFRPAPFATNPSAGLATP